MATLIRDVSHMQRIGDETRASGRRIAVVPTMGYLHEGHLSLIRIAKQHADVVVTTIFVNPAQFGPAEDFERYPRALSHDTTLALSAGTDYLFTPDTKAMYASDHRSFVTVEGLDSVLEGKARPGHFRGVATVVAKLFNICKPHVAVFGQKDAQQVVVIRQMVKDLNFDIELVVAPTVREHDGLAMSSRNTYLNSEQRAGASVLYRALKQADRLIREKVSDPSQVIQAMEVEITSRSSGIIDYISIADGVTLEELQTCKDRRPILVSLAVRFGATRLIDNIVVVD